MILGGAVCVCGWEQHEHYIWNSARPRSQHGTLVRVSRIIPRPSKRALDFGFQPRSRFASEPEPDCIRVAASHPGRGER